LIWALIIVGVIIALYIITMSIMLLIVSGRWRGKALSAENALKHTSWGKYRQQIFDGKQWFLDQNPERLAISSFDGTKLSAYYLPSQGADTTVILMHGFRSSPLVDFGCAFKFYHGLGLNILAPYQRAHGESGGKYICFGVKERFDCLEWANYIDGRVGGKIILGGTSMGATTVMLATGLKLPEAVKCVVADCGFVSARGIFLNVLRRRHIPAKNFVLALFKPWVRLIAGWNISECSTVDAMRGNTLPILFFHGEADELVPCEMSRENYGACAAEKELILTPGAGHCVSYLIDTDTYQAAIRRFFNKYVGLATGKTEPTDAQRT
jgi:fermentation-respiration switch protein FrsA (DUF1100 family)